MSNEQLPELGELREIQVPQEYRGEDPQRIKDYLTGFQVAWELAVRVSRGMELDEPQDEPRPMSPQNTPKNGSIAPTGF